MEILMQRFGMRVPSSLRAKRRIANSFRLEAYSVIGCLEASAQTQTYREFGVGGKICTRGTIYPPLMYYAPHPCSTLESEVRDAVRLEVVGPEGRTITELTP